MPIHDKNGRKCSKCKTYKLWSHFSFSEKGFNGHHSWCRSCCNKNNDSDYILSYSRLLRYGLTQIEFEIMIQEQNYGCKICRCTLNFKTAQVDHCHITNKIRGLLCRSCNTLLGQAKDDITILQNAITYLETSNADNRRWLQEKSRKGLCLQLHERLAPPKPS